MADNLIQATLALKDLNFSSGLQNAARQLQSFSNSTNGMNSQMQNFGSGLENMGNSVANAGTKIQNFGNNAQKHLSGIGKGMMVAGAATTAMGMNSVKSFGQFQQSLNTAAVVAGGTSKDIAGLSEVANKMGADLPLSAQDAADAMIEMARNGASLDDLKQQFPAIAKAATAAGSDLQATAGVVQLAMNVWGKSLKSPEQAAEILVQTANLSNASVEDMQEVIGTLGPTANMAGYGMRDMSTAIGLVTNHGMSAANAAQDLNFALLKMMAPTKVSSSAMEALGLKVRDAQGNMRLLPAILEDVANATAHMSKEQRDAVLKDLWGTAGMKAMLPLLDSVKDKTGNTATSWNAFSGALDKAAGSTEAATKSLDTQASEMQKNVGAKVEQVGGNWESLRNSVMQSNQGIAGSMLDNTNHMLEWAKDSNDALAQVTRGFIALSPVIGPAMTAVGGFLTNFSKITGVIGGTVKGLGNLASTIGVVSQALNAGKGISGAATALGELANKSKIAKVAQLALNGATRIGTAIQAAFNAVIDAGPWGIVAIAIAAVVAALVLFFTKTKMGQQIWQNFTKFLSDAWNNLKELAGTVWQGITSTISKAGEDIKQGWNGTTEWFSNLWDSIKQVWSGATEWFNNLWSEIKEGASSAWQGFSDFMAPIVQSIQNAWNGLTDFFSNLWNGIKTVCQNVWNSFVEGMTPIIESIKNLWSALTEFFSVLWQGLVSLAQTIWSGLVTIFSPIIEGIKTVWNGLTQFFSGLWQGIVTVAQTIWNGLSQFFSSLWQGIVNTAQTIWNGLTVVFQTIWNVIQTAAQVAWQVISQVLQTMWQNIVIVAQTVWNSLVTIISGIWEQIKAVVSTALNVISTIIQTVMGVIQAIWQAAWNVLTTIISTVWQAISTVVSTAINAVAGIIRAVTQAIQGNWTGAWNEIKGVASSIWNGLKSLASTIFNGLKSIITAVLNGIRGIWNSIWNGIKGITSAVWNGITSVVSSGLNTLRSLASNIMSGVQSIFNNGWNGIKSVFSWGVDALKGMFNFSLFNQGYRIISSLLDGLQSAFRSVQSFVSGIGSWIQSHKGPKQYDLHLLIPAGGYIMSGFQKGLENGYSDVQSFIGGIADDIAGTSFNAPSLNTQRLDWQISQLNSNMRNSLSANVDQRLSLEKQPAYIDLTLGGTEYRTFVDDISREQGKQAEFKRNYKF
ncbi:MAG: phage tail tape measure protein [Lactobacillus sp.]|nr:phage tail tape measure protein [Lactobacillus sp.]